RREDRAVGRERDRGKGAALPRESPDELRREVLRLGRAAAVPAEEDGPTAGHGRGEELRHPLNPGPILRERLEQKPGALLEAAADPVLPLHAASPAMAFR